jgi:hypothetical protein
MRCRWGERTALVLALLSPAPVLAQAHELGLGAISTFSDPALAVGGVYAALRTSSRTRVSGSLSVGGSSGEFAWRGELLGHFLFSPAERRKAGVYFAGGLALVEGPVQRGYLVLTLGLEARPGASSGWAVEAGVGGGVRLGVGYRWRWFPLPTQ